MLALIIPAVVADFVCNLLLASENSLLHKFFDMILNKHPLFEQQFVNSINE